MRQTILVACVSLVTLDAVYGTVIPRPDVVVFGTVRIGGRAATETEDLSVIARLGDRKMPVAVYHIGSQPTAGDRYVLWIPQAVLEDGKTPSPDFPKPGDVAKLYVRQGSGPEVYAADIVIPNSGEAKQVDLKVSAAELAAQGVPGDGGGACGQGTCGATGMISLSLTFCSLAHMKHRRMRRRCSDLQEGEANG